MTNKRYFIIMKSTREPMLWGNAAVYFSTKEAAHAFFDSIRKYAACSASLNIILNEGVVVAEDECEWQPLIASWEQENLLLDFTKAVFYYDYEYDTEYVTIEGEQYA